MAGVHIEKFWNDHRNNQKLTLVETFIFTHNILKQELAGTTTPLVPISTEFKTTLVMVILDLRTPQFLSPKKYSKHFHKGVSQKEFKNITCLFKKNRITHLWLRGETKHILEIHPVYSFSKHKHGVV